MEQIVKFWSNLAKEKSILNMDFCFLESIFHPDLIQQEPFPAVKFQVDIEANAAEWFGQIQSIFSGR